MSKKWKTRLGFISLLSYIPLVILFKLNYISEGEGVILTIVMTIFAGIFLRDYVRDLGKYDNRPKF